MRKLILTLLFLVGSVSSAEAWCSDRDYVLFQDCATIMLNARLGNLGSSNWERQDMIHTLGRCEMLMENGSQRWLACLERLRRETGQ